MGLFETNKALKINEEVLDNLTSSINSIEETYFEATIGALGWLGHIKPQTDHIEVLLNLPTPALLGLPELKAQITAAIHAQLPKTQIVIETAHQIQSAVGPAFSSQAIPGVKNIVLVASGKGGVGKSTVASNLAVALAQTGAKVGLLDADMYGPSMPTMFGVPADIRPSSIPGPTPERPVMVPLQRFGIKLISIGFLVDTKTPMIWRGPMLASASMQLFKEVFWEELDYLFVDLPPGTGDIQLTIAQQVAVAGAVIVSTPQDVALADVVRAKAMFDKVKIPSLGVIENMSYFVCDNCDKRHEIFTSGGAEKAAEQLGLPFIGAIPLEGDVRAGGDEGHPVLLSHPELQSSKDLVQIAHSVATSLAKRAYQLQFDSGDKGPSLKISGGINKTATPKSGGLPIIN